VDGGKKMKAGFCNSLFYILLILLIIPGMTPGLASALGDSQNTNSGYSVSDSGSSSAGDSISDNGSSDSGNSISDSGSSDTGDSVSNTDNKSSDSGNSSTNPSSGNSSSGNSSTNPSSGNSSSGNSSTNPSSGNSSSGNSSTNPSSGNSSSGNSSTNPSSGNSSTNSNSDNSGSNSVKVDSSTSSDSGSSDNLSSDSGDSNSQNLDNTSSDNESSSNESSSNESTSSGNDSSSDSSSSSSGSGLSVISSGELSSNIAVKEYSTMNVMAGYPVKFDFVENSTCIEYIQFDPKKTFRQTTAVVEELKNTSTLVSTPAPGKIYKNVNIWVGEGAGLPTALKDGIVGFRVEKSWIKEQNISDSLITLQRYDNGWQSLSTKKVGEDDNYVYFEAETPGYSCFAITDYTGQSGEENKTLVEQEITKTLKTLGANNSMLQNPMRAGRIVMSVSFPMFLAIAGYFVLKRKI
jgi:clumping factor A